MCEEALGLPCSVAFLRALSEPLPLRRHTARAWYARWVTLLSVAAQDAFAAASGVEGTSLLEACSRAPPLSVDVWLDGGGVDLGVGLSPTRSAGGP